jgi:hypothetical protein
MPDDPPGDRSGRGSSHEDSEAGSCEVGGGDRLEPDVLLLHGPTEDGEGARVLRARGERLEAGEVRPMREGAPLAPRSEVVRLTPRRESPALFDVHVEHQVPAASAGPPRPTTKAGPPQVATREYRESWERTFGTRRAKTLN